MLPSTLIWPPISLYIHCIVTLWCKATMTYHSTYTITQDASWQAWHYPATYSIARGESTLARGAEASRRKGRTQGDRGPTYLDPQLTCLHACVQAHPPQMLQVGLLGLVGLTAQQVGLPAEPEPRRPFFFWSSFVFFFLFVSMVLR